jgi:hypothetical protein
MALTQDRFIAVLNAARGIINSYNELRDAIREALLRPPREATREELFAMMNEISEAMRLIQLNPDAMALIYVEAKHFEIKAKDNARRAGRARVKRLERAGLLPAGSYQFSRKGQTLNLSDEAKALHFAQAEQIVAATAPKAALSPIKQLAKRVDHSAHKGKTNETWTEEKLAIEGFEIGPVSNAKHEINAIHRAVKMPEPYPDPYNASQLITREHFRALQSANPDLAASLPAHAIERDTEEGIF